MKKKLQARLDAINGKFRNGCIALVGAAPVLAMATPTDPFDDAVSTITTKVQTYGGALVTVAAASVVFFVAMKYVKKLPRAA